MANKGIIRNLLNDEYRNLNNEYLNNEKTNNLNLNNNLRLFNTDINDKYSRHINKEQTIKENLGLIYNNDIENEIVINKSNLSELNTNKQLNNIDIENKYLIISSEDRPWNINNNENIYNFQVDCGDISLISDNQMSSAGIRHSMENVISIMVSNIIIPNRLMENNIKITNYPYLQVQINGIEHTSFGTNKSSDLALGIMTPKIPLPQNFDNVNYLEMVNINKQIKRFYTPKARLNKLNLSILRNDGEQLLNNNILSRRDILNIKKIFYDTSSELLHLYTDTYFSTNNFKTNDIIKIRNYNFRETNLGFSECFEFNRFINKNDGHIIVSTDKSTIDSDIIYHNIIKINIPRTINLETGKYEKITWFDNLITKTNIESDLEDDDSGMLINTSLQIQIFLNIKILNKHSSRLIKNIDMK
jgi:hypothetical protein